MAIEYYSSIDLNKNELQNAVIQNAGSAPGSPAEGQIYYDSTSGDKALHFYNGSAWIRVAGQATAQATDTIASGDFMAFSDESETGDINNKITIDNLFKTAPALLTEAAVANGDYIMFLDGGATGDAKKEAVHDLATLFAGSGLTATNSVIAVDTLNQDTTGTAAIATTVTVADESSDTTCFPLFVTAATGDLAPKSGSNITFNSSSGVLAVSGVTANGFTGDLTGDVTGNADTATVATTVTITDNESTNEENALIFTAGGDVDGGNLGLESDGNATYNPSTGTITATIFKGNIDAVDGDFDGTLEADALTIGGTNILTGGIVTTLGTISQDSVVFTSANANDPLVVIKNTTNDANGARLRFLKDKGAAAADNDEIGEIMFAGDDAAQSETEFGKISVQVGEADNTDEAGLMKLQVASSDGTTTGLTSGLVLTGHKTSDYVDVTLGSGSSSTVTIPGNLTVSGTTTTVNSTTVTLNDHNIVLDTGNSTSAVVDGAGITIEGGSGDDATFTYNTTGPKFEMKLGSSYEDLKVDGLIAASLDISGSADIDGTMEADAYTVNGTALSEYIADTVGAMFSSNTETGITATYQDGDNTIDLVVSGASANTILVTDSTANTAFPVVFHDESNSLLDDTEAFTYNPQSATLVVANLDIGTDVDIDGTLETDALTIAGTAIVAQATASAVGGVELATAAEVITGTDAARVVTADTLSAKSVVCDIDVSSLTDANIVTITHNLGTADILVQVYDKTTEANIMCDIARTTDDFSTASTSVVSIDFGTAPPNDCRALITSLAGATAGSIAYT